MPSLGRMIDVAESIRTPAVAVCAQHCTHRHHQASTCSRCEQVCPTGAITVSAAGPSVDPMACIDCGACASICPTGAVEPLKPREPALVEKVGADAAFCNRVIIACAQISTAGSGIITLTCLARLDPSLLLYAIARGAATVTLCTGVCEECSARDVASHVSAVVANTEHLLGAFGLRGRVDLSEGLVSIGSEDPQPAGLTRRGFFQVLRKGGAGYAAKAMGAFMADEAAPAEEQPRRELPAHVPAKQHRLVASLRALVPAGSAARTLPGPFMVPQLDGSSCNGCGICGRICPTGALGIEEDDRGDPIRITCRTSACVACGLCTEMCRQQALSLAPVPIDSVLADDGRRQTLFERAQHETEPLGVSFEDRMKKLLGVAVYRT